MYELPGLTIPITTIDERRRDEYLQAGYNPRQPDSDHEQFSKEWFGVFDRLEAALSRHWKRGIGNGDFFLDSDMVPHRFLCVEVSKPQMLTGQLLRIVHEVVVSCEQPYAVDVCNSWVFLKTEDGTAHPHFNIFIEKDRILIYSESDSLIAKFGLKAK
jgi:hypothetical protein